MSDLISCTDIITEIVAERRRQMEVEGWCPRHDDEHRDGSLASAAACYAVAPRLRGEKEVPSHYGWTGCARYDDSTWSPRATSMVPLAWPDSWDGRHWKPKDRRRDLIRAAALIVAEIERLDRAAAAASNPSDQRAGASPAPLYQVVGQTADDRLSYVDAELRKWYGDDPAPIEHIARSVKKHCDDLSARLDAVRDELEDWKDAARAAASGGHPDEVHCTCVPLLQKSLKDCKREREELLAIADRTREQLAARVRYLEREMGDLDQEMEWLQGDIEGQAQRDRIVLYHHNCMSGTDCDACRVMGRIRDIRARLCLPNPTDHGARSAPVHPVVGRISESGEKP